MRLIDADALKLEIACVYGSNPKYINWLNHAPTVDAEPVRHGKWLYGESESGHDGYYCSQCGKHVRWIYGEEDINFIRSYKYCPNCGARMDKE